MYNVLVFLRGGNIMSIGNNISNLRKENNLSQEELAEKVGVTRQTISKWELDETSPDINQAKIISQTFNISLDELTDNDVNNVIIEKVSNTEKLAGITIKILKLLGIGFVVFLVIILIALIVFNLYRIDSRDYKVTGKISISCKLNNEKYLYEVEHNKNYQVISAGGDAWIPNHIDIEKYEDANQVIAHIEDYFKEHGGSCNITN